MSRAAAADAHPANGRVAQERAAYLASLTGLLWPGAETGVEGRSRHGGPATAGGRGRVLEEYLVLPDRKGPRLLLPLRARAAAAGAVRRASEPQSLPSRLRREAVALSVRTGIAEAVLPRRYRVRSSGHGAQGKQHPGESQTIEAYLRDVLGDVVLSFWLAGQGRANRKPVLQVLATDGRTLGFVKIGTNELTRRLVRSERAALELLGAHRDRLPTVVVPTVLHAAQWRDLEVLVQSALPVWRRRSAADTPAVVATAAREIAEVLGRRAAPLATSPWFEDLRQRIAAVDHRDSAGGNASLRAACHYLNQGAGTRIVTFGAGHGDWTPWNRAHLPGRLLVWDWERFSTDLPIGFDPVHEFLQRCLERGLEPAAAGTAALREAPATLAPLGVDPEAAELVALLYLLEIASRYASDGAELPGARSGRVGRALADVACARAHEWSTVPGGST